MQCGRCSKKVLSRQQFISELSNKHNIRVDHASLDPVLSGGVSGGYGAVETAKQQVHAIYRQIEKDRAFKCSACGKTYCMDCLFNYAPTHSNGGKACFVCGGSFVEV